MGLGRECNGLYLLEKSYSTPTFVSAIVSVNKTQPHVWHSRLGHLSNDKLALLNNNHVPLFNPFEKFHCDVCPLVKQKRLPFNKSTHITNNCFDLIHYDLWGPFFFFYYE